MSHPAIVGGGTSDAVAMAQERQALQQMAPVSSTPPVSHPAPAVETEKPKDFAVVVSFGATTTINDKPAEIPKLETETLANVTTFLAAHKDARPVAITRTGDTYILNMGDNKMIKARTGNIEEAVHNGVLPKDSPLLSALKMTELTTSVDLPAKAQRKIQELATSQGFDKAQHNAVLAAYVEKFNKIAPAVGERVGKAYAAKPEVQTQWEAYKTAYAAASESGDYEAVFDKLNQFTATVEGLEKGSDSPWLKPQLPEKDALPPSNIITMANLAGIKLSKAVADSGQTVADPKDVSKTITAPTLTPADKKAIENPRAFLASIGNDWNTARKMYREGKLTHPGAGMQALLDFRKTVVEDILRQVKVETKAHVQARRDALNADLPEGEKITAPIKDLGWSAAGSTDATSDIDTSLSGDGTEFAAERFNQLFSKAWGRDSGIVFDVNVYARDFVPQLDKMAFHKASKDELSADAQAAADKTIKWDTDITGTGHEAAWNLHQEEQALYSTRSHMSKAEWDTYKGQMLTALDALPTAPVDKKGPETLRLNTLFATVEKKFTDHNDSVAKQALTTINEGLAKEGKPALAALPHYDREAPHATQHALEHFFHGDTAKAQAETSALAAENSIYHTYLQKNEGLREQRLVAETKLTALQGRLAVAEASLQKAEGTRDPDAVQLAKAEVATLTKAVADQKTIVGDLTFGLKKAISESLNYANETYATEGALLHTVGNKQMLSKGPYADIGSKPRLGKIKLSEHQWTQAFREQIGMSFKELTRRENMGDSLIQGGKYIHRALNAAKHVQKMTGMPVAGPPSLDFLRFLSKETVGTKKDGKVVDMEKGAAAIHNLKQWVIANPGQGLTVEDVSDQAKMRAVLMKFSGEVEKTYQKWIAAGRPDPKTVPAAVVVNPDIRVPSTSYRALKGRADAKQQVAMANLVVARVAVSEAPKPAQVVALVVPKQEKAVLVTAQPVVEQARKVIVSHGRRFVTPQQVASSGGGVPTPPKSGVAPKMASAVQRVQAATAQLKDVGEIAQMTRTQLLGKRAAVNSQVRALEVKGTYGSLNGQDQAKLGQLRQLRDAIDARLEKKPVL